MSVFNIITLADFILLQTFFFPISYLLSCHLDSPLLPKAANGNDLIYIVSYISLCSYNPVHTFIYRIFLFPFYKTGFLLKTFLYKFFFHLIIHLGQPFRSMDTEVILFF